MDRRQSERPRNDTEAKKAGKCRKRKALILLQLGALQPQARVVHAYGGWAFERKVSRYAR
jgi:hypothetical protein